MSRQLKGICDRIQESVELNISVQRENAATVAAAVGNGSFSSGGGGSSRYTTPEKFSSPASQGQSQERQQSQQQHERERGPEQEGYGRTGPDFSSPEGVKGTGGTLQGPSKSFSPSTQAAQIVPASLGAIGRGGVVSSYQSRAQNGQQQREEEQQQQQGFDDSELASLIRESLRQKLLETMREPADSEPREPNGHAHAHTHAPAGRSDGGLSNGHGRA